MSEKKIIYDGKNCPEATCKGQMRKSSLTFLGYDCIFTDTVCDKCEFQVTEYYFLKEVDVEGEGTYRVETPSF